MFESAIIAYMKWQLGDRDPSNMTDEELGSFFMDAIDTTHEVVRSLHDEVPEWVISACQRFVNWPTWPVYTPEVIQQQGVLRERLKMLLNAKTGNG